MTEKAKTVYFNAQRGVSAEPPERIETPAEYKRRRTAEIGEQVEQCYSDHTPIQILRHRKEKRRS